MSVTDTQSLTRPDEDPVNQEVRNEGGDPERVMVCFNQVNLLIRETVKLAIFNTQIPLTYFALIKVGMSVGRS